MSKSKGRRLAEWLRNLDTNSQPAGGGIKDGTISTAKLVDDAVTSAKIADSAVTTAHLADTGVTFGKLHSALVVTESDAISSNDNDTTIATSAAIIDHVATEVAALVDSAPGALNTLNELAAAVNDDASFSTTITNSIALKAPLASPALTGTPTAPTASSGTNTTQLATTAFVTAATSGLATDTNLANKAPINSPTFTGTPAAPTASSGTNTTQIATTAFVTTAVAGATIDGISSSADATAITIDSNENVGIGTSPSAPLHVKVTESSTGETDPLIRFERFTSGDNAYLDITVDNNNNLIGFQSTGSSDGGFTFGGASTERMRIDSSGKVGIGTTSPVSPLDVKGTAPIVTANSNVFASSGNGTGFGIYRSASGRTAGYTWTIENVIASGGSSSSDYQIDNLVFKNRASVSDSSLTERMRISSAGNVGIGTTSPTANCKLHIADADAQIELEGTGGSNSGFIDFDGTNLQLSTNRNMKDGAFSNTGKSNASILLLGPSGGSTIRFYTASANNTTASERMRIDSNGTVGVGVTPATDFSEDGFQIGARGTLHGGTSYTGYAFNAYPTDAGWSAKYTTTDEASLYLQGAGFHLWYSAVSGTAGTAVTWQESMRIDTSGNLLIGKTATNFSNDGLELRGGGDGRLYVTNTDDASTVFRRDGSNGIIQYFYRANNFVGSISVSTTSTAYNTSSDERLKENIVDASAGNIDAIRVRSFDWKADGVHQPHGMIAQELVDVAPEAVTQGKTNDDMWQVDYSKLVPMMIKEIQDLRARVAQLEGA